MVCKESQICIKGALIRDSYWKINDKAQLK